MEYNKFIYKINKYKLYLRESNKDKKDHYQKKIDFYYKKIDEIVDDIKNKKGGGFTNADLVNFLEPTTKSLEEHLDKKANIDVFQQEQKKYEKNHKEIIKFLDNLLDANNWLQKMNNEADEKLEEIKEQFETMDDAHKKDIKEKLEKIKRKVDEQKKLTHTDIETKYKFKF